MAKRSLLSRVKISELQKGIHDNVVITNVDIKDRRGQNGPINKMIYIKFSKLNDSGKRLAESELAWWKPDPTSEYFVTNLQELCLQLHNILEVYIGEEKAFEAFSDVFSDIKGIETHQDIHNKKWKQSEVNTLLTNLKSAFKDAMDSALKDSEVKFRLKLTTNYKGEDIEIPKYGKFVESMDVNPSTLKFTTSELKTHSKSGITTKRENSSSSINVSATI
jgi:hypothetical protein